MLERCVAVRPLSPVPPPPPKKRVLWKKVFSRRSIFYSEEILESGHVRPRQGQKSAISGNFLLHWDFSGKKKHININKFAGLSRDWVGAKNLFMCFFRVIPYGGEKHINKIPPKIPGQSRENFVYVFFSLCVFSPPNFGAHFYFCAHFTAKIGTWTCLTKGSEMAFWEGSATESAQSWNTQRLQRSYF